MDLLETVSPSKPLCCHGVAKNNAASKACSEIDSLSPELWFSKLFSACANVEPNVCFCKGAMEESSCSLLITNLSVHEPAVFCAFLSLSDYNLYILPFGSLSLSYCLGSVF